MWYRTLYYKENPKAEYQRRKGIWFKRLINSKSEWYPVDAGGQDLLDKEFSHKSSFYFYSNSVLTIIGVAIGVILYFGYNYLNEDTVVASQKYDCESFEDCISKYEFDGAYYFYSLEPSKEKERNLINAQVAFWCKENNYDKAFNVLQEYKIETIYNLNSGDPENEKNVQYNEEVNFYNNLLDDVINKMLINKEPKEEIRTYCKAFKPTVIGNENDKSIFGSYKSSVLVNVQYDKAIQKVNRINR